MNGTTFDYNLSYDGSTGVGYNISTTQSEMGYMFYQNLGNKGWFDTAVGATGCTGVDCLTNTGLFDYLESGGYWSSVEFAAFTRFAWAFGTRNGGQTFGDKTSVPYAWAVRSGDVTVVPVPAAVWLMGSAFLGLAGFSRKRNTGH